MVERNGYIDPRHGGSHIVLGVFNPEDDDYEPIRHLQHTLQDHYADVYRSLLTHLTLDLIQMRSLSRLKSCVGASKLAKRQQQLQV